SSRRGGGRGRPSRGWGSSSRGEQVPAVHGAVQPATTGLATAFLRFYLLDTLSSAPARPASPLAGAAATTLRCATGAFGRALQALLEAAHLTPARDGTVALTA